MTSPYNDIKIIDMDIVIGFFKENDIFDSCDTKTDADLSKICNSGYKLRKIYELIQRLSGYEIPINKLYNIQNKIKQDKEFYNDLVNNKFTRDKIHGEKEIKLLNLIGKKFYFCIDNIIFKPIQDGKEYVFVVYLIKEEIENECNDNLSVIKQR